MKKRIILVLGLVIIILGLFGLDLANRRSQQSTSPVSSSTAQSQTSSGRSLSSKHHRILIVYFSRSGTNYPGVNLKQGHVHRIANEIAKVTKGTTYQIIPAKAYPKNYQDTVDQAQREQTKNARPKLAKKIPDLSKYDTVFLGYPIWWSSVPMVVRTFMDRANLNGKTVIPFSSNEGSGWGDSLTTIRHQYPKAKLLKGFSIEGEQADKSQRKIDNWLKNLGY